MSTYLDEAIAGQTISLPPLGGMPASKHVIDLESILAINAALATRRPLLVRGEPGVGKSQLARAAAVKLERPFISHAVDGRTETRDLLFTVDLVARLAEAQILGAMHRDDIDKARERIDVQRFAGPGPLWWAYDWASATAQVNKACVPFTSYATLFGELPERGAVVLIDELDKADSAVPSALLDALGHQRFDVLGRVVKMDQERPPLIVITTNEERSLPDAFLRRCLVLHLGLPRDDKKLKDTLIERGRAHFPDCDPGVLSRAVDLVIVDRKTMIDRGLAPPGLAEYLDLVDAATKQRDDSGAQIALLDRIACFALQKHPPEHEQ